MRYTRSRPFGAAVALCCALACSPLNAQEAAVQAAAVPAARAFVYRVLKLEGHQVRWQPPADGGPRMLTYRLVNDTMTFPAARNCHGLTALDGLAATSNLSLAAIKAETRAAFNMWEGAANIVFREAPQGARADILIGAQTEPDGWAFTDVFYDTSAPGDVKPISQSLVCFNPTKRWKVGFNGDLQTYDVRYALAHEIGHAIGLDHPAGGNAIMNFRYQERFRTLQPGDIYGATLLYGAPRRPELQVASGPKAAQAATAVASRVAGAGLAEPAPTHPK